MRKLLRFGRNLLWTVASLFFIGIIAFAFLYFYLSSQLPNIEALKKVQLQVPLRIYTEEGLLIQEYGEKRRIPITYSDIPPILIHAILATEDQRFFEHPGVDVLGLGRATLRMIQTGTKSQGGSTITMQVARNFFLTRKKTFLRKFNEILLAIKIDKELSKEKILELYLNKIYLGNRAYGVGAAAEVYYGKSLNQLNLAELAMLAGLPQAPSTQNPIANPQAAKKRRDHVLDRLREDKFITQEEYESAVKEPVTAIYHGAKVQVSAPYVAEMIRQSLYDHFGEETYTKGYRVYTTIKGPLQIAANRVLKQSLLSYEKRHGYRGPIGHLNIGQSSPAALTQILNAYPVINSLQPAIVLSMKEQELTVLFKNGKTALIPWSGMSWAKPALKQGWVGKAPTQAKQIARVGDIIYTLFVNDQWQLSQAPGPEAALVALNPNNGALEALVGGFDFQKSKFNRATQSERQPGSSFKPFIYAAALSKNYNLATIINDAPVVVSDANDTNLWRPRNVNLTFNGPTRLKEALVHYRNLVSIRILDDLGFDYAINFLARFGFAKEKLPHALSLALGSLSVSPLELSAAYAIFANGGYKIEPFLIEKITDNQDEILLQAKPSIVCSHCDMQDIDTSTLAPRVIPADIAFLINSALKEVIQRGTAHAAKSLNREDLAGKTGTTNEQFDTWFAGFNPDLVVTTWVGYDTPQSLHEYAASLALPMWIDFMRTALDKKPEKNFEQPDNIISVRIDPVTGKLANTNQNNSIIEFFREEDLSNNNDIQSSTSSPYLEEDTTTEQQSLF